MASIEVPILPAGAQRKTLGDGRCGLVHSHGLLYACGAEDAAGAVVALEVFADGGVANSIGTIDAVQQPAWPHVSAIAASPDGTVAAYASGDAPENVASECAVSLFALPELRPLRRLMQPSAPARAIAFSADGSLV